MSNILIAGLHKTGTTGLYSALRSALPTAGHFFLFEPKSPESFLALGRYAPYDSIVAKVLVNRLGDCAIRYGDFDRRVMMVRDPRDMVVSRLLFRPMLGNVSYHIDVENLQPFIRALREKEEDPARHSLKSLHELADRLGIGKSGWPQLAQQMSQQMKLIGNEGFFVLHYEDFVTDRLAAVSEYVGVPIQNGQDPDGWTSHIRRSMGYGDWRHWFLDEDAEFFGEMFADYMNRFGYRDWERVADPWIDPATSSDYVAGPTTDRIRERQHRERGRWVPDRVQTREELRQLISMAEDGRAGWAYRLARLYSEDTGFGPEAHEALRWARHGARLGDAGAMSLCAGLLRRTADEDRHAELEARFWQRESDRLTGRQRTAVGNGGASKQRGKRRPDSRGSRATKHSPSKPPASRRDTGGSRRTVVARLHRNLEPFLGGSVRDSPRNAVLVLRRTGHKLKRRLPHPSPRRAAATKR